MINSEATSNAERKRVFHLKKKFLYNLKNCPGYPFNEYEDGAYFHYAYEEYPYVDLIKELDKKIAWWKDHPEALRKKDRFHRTQLDEWFQLENEYQAKKWGESENE